MAAPSQQKDSISSTLELRKGKYQDLLYQKLPLLDAFKKFPGGRDMVDGGAEKAYEIIVKPHAGIVEHTTGYEARTTTVDEVMELARFYFYLYSTVIAITKKDRLENAGKAAQVKLMEARMVAQLGHIMRAQEAHFLRNEGAFAKLLSLDGSTTVGAAANGHLEYDAIGAQTNTIGTLARASFTPYLDNQVIDIQDDYSLYGKEALNLGMTRCWSYAAPQATTLFGILSEILFSKYMTDQETQVRFTSKEKLDSGGVELMTLHGHILKPSPSLGYLGADGTTYISGFMLDIGGHFLIVNKNADWSIDPPREADQQLLLSRDLCWHGQLGFQHGMRGSAVIKRGES